MTDRIVDINNLQVAFHGNRVVHGINLHIDRGETLALVGESGSGKSVTALSIPQLLPYPQASHPDGSILLDGVEMIGASRAMLLKMRGNRVSMIFQEPMTSLNPLHTIGKQVGEVLVVHQHMGREAVRSRTLELLELVGLQRASERLKAYPHELSGGQRQRVMIAMALANEPDLLVADEPTTALDVTIQAQILALLTDLQKRLNMALLLITHDLTTVRRIADRVCVMNKGEIVEEATTEALFQTPQHPYTQSLLAAQPSGQPVAAPKNASILVAAKDVRVHFPLGGGLFSKKRVLKAVDKVSLSIKAGHTIGVVGESGSGKTTLGMALMRLQQCQGRISFDGTDLQQLPARDLKPFRQRMQVVFQDPYGSLSPRRSIRQIVEQGLLVHASELTRKERDVKVEEALIDVGLNPDDKERYPHEFSGGQRQRIAIARVMILRPEFIVLDEPTSALDMSVQAKVIDLLRDLQQRHGLAYLFISHDLKVVRALADELVVMKDGVIVEHGPAADVFAHPQTDYTRSLLAAAFDLEVVVHDV